MISFTMKTDFSVVIRCMTYNHVHFIRDALNGFCMQQTSFPFIAIVCDDASRDGEPEVIRNYIKEHFVTKVGEEYQTWETDEALFIFSHHQQNPNCYFLVTLLKTNYYSQRKSKEQLWQTWVNSAKYIALCEGDDYWIDSSKLQKQVDFLECHQDCVLCGTNGLIVYQDGLRRPSYFNKFFHTVLLKPEDIIGKWIFPTASLMYRREVTEDYPEWTKHIYSGDQTLMLIALSKGNIYAIEGLTCVYRKDINGLSVSNVKDKEFLFVENQHLMLYRYYYDYVNNAKLKAITSSYILQLEKHIEQRKKNKTFNELYRRSVLRPFFWNFSFSCKKYKELIRNYCIHKLTEEK